MSDLWNYVRSLQGQELATLCGKPFTVQAVTETTVTVVPHSTGKPRPIRRQAIEAAAKLSAGPHGLTATAVREAGASEFNPVYVVAIIRALSEPMKPPAGSPLDDAFRRMDRWRESAETHTGA